jgi:hypothetical protein
VREKQQKGCKGNRSAGAVEAMICIQQHLVHQGTPTPPSASGTASKPSLNHRLLCCACCAFGVSSTPGAPAPTHSPLRVGQLHARTCRPANQWMPCA